MTALVGYASILMFLFLILFGAVWTALSFYLLARARRSASWSEAVGTVSSTEVKRVESGDARTGTGYSVTYEPYIKYEYSVGASKYANTTYAVAPLPWTADPAPAEAILRSYPVGGQVPVFYDPANPSDSALVAGGSKGNWYFLLLGGVFIAAGVLGLVKRW